MKKIMLTMLSGSLVFGFSNTNAGVAVSAENSTNIVSESNETNNQDINSNVTTEEAQKLQELACIDFSQVNSEIVRLDGLEAFTKGMVHWFFHAKRKLIS